MAATASGDGGQGIPFLQEEPGWGGGKRKTNGHAMIPKILALTQTTRVANCPFLSFLNIVTCTNFAYCAFEKLWSFTFSAVGQ